MRYLIVRVTPTDYPPDADREKLQKLADDLNLDAIGETAEDRWIVVMEAVVLGLFEKE